MNTPCQDKIRYTSKQAARKALAWHRGSAAVMRAYLCELCHAWHLGHPGKRP